MLIWTLEDESVIAGHEIDTKDSWTASLYYCNTLVENKLMDAVIGYVHLTSEPSKDNSVNRSVIIRDLKFYPEYQNFGLGAAFLRVIEDYANRRKCEVIAVDPLFLKSSDTLKEMFRDNGFAVDDIQIAGKIVGETDEDEVDFTCKDNGHRSSPDKLFEAEHRIFKAHKDQGAEYMEMS